VSLWFRQLECNDINLMLLSDAPLASALAGMLLPLLANMLTVWCVFRLAKDRFGSRAGLYAAALWVIVPSAVLFPGSWSLAYPCIACLTWLAVDAGLRRRSVGFWAGLCCPLARFELGTAALGLFLALYILLRYVLARRNPLADWRFLIPALIVTLLGVSSV
jgi:Gpi18-like mannosyltransferase